MRTKPDLIKLLTCIMLISILLPVTGFSQLTEIKYTPYKQFLLTRQTMLCPFSLVPATYSVSAVRFYSSDTSVAIVDDKGNVTGREPGWANIYAVSKYSIAGDLVEVHVRDDNTSLKIEAEDALVTSPLRIADDTTASGGKCLVYDSGPHSQSVVPDSGHATFTINLEEEGLFALFISLMAADKNNNSFYFRVDTLEWNIISAPQTSWSEETKLFTHNFPGIIEYPFLAGEHTVELAYRQPGVKLDYIRLIRDSSSVHRYESHYSEVFGQRRWINVMLPSYYDKTDQRFPLITFSHGWGDCVFRQDNDAFPHLDYNRIQERIDEDSAIFVFTDGKIIWFDDGSMSYYSPYNMVPLFDLWYEDYFPELWEYMDANYRTIPDRYHRAVMGQSMGGGMVLRLGQRHPDKIAAVQPTCPGSNPLLGVPDRYIRCFTHEFVRNLHGTHIRIHETFDDYLKPPNQVLYAAMEREQLESIAWSEIEGGHTIDLAGQTIGFDACFDFMMASIDDPLPVPERWHFAEFRSGFSVWDYSVTSDMERIGFLDFTGVTKGGMKVFARKWLPDGPGIPEVSINVTTAPLYKTNSPYTLHTWDLTEDSSSTKTVMSDGDGRLSFSLSGKGCQVGIYDDDTPPEIVFLAYRIGDDGKFLTQGEEGQLKIQVLNRGGQAAQDITIELSADMPSVNIENKTLTITNLDAGASLWLDESIGITADYDPPAHKSPLELRLNASISDASHREWKDELYVPVMFDVPVISNFIINDNVPEGTQNRINGFAGPGEMIVIETSLEERLRLQYEDEYIEFDEEEAIFPDHSLSYSVIKISEEAPVGHQVSLQARYEADDADVSMISYSWGKVILEISDHTSVKSIPELDHPRDNQVSVYPNPVSGGIFTLECGSGVPAGILSLKITDIKGRIVFNTIIERIENVNRFIITPGEELNQGFYVLSLEAGGSISRTKLIIR
jgi:enterochelin esterase-like enzyme